MSDRRPRAFTEYFRLHDGQMDDTQFNIVSQDEVAIPDTGYAGGYGDGGRVYYPSYPSDRTYYPNSYGGLGSFFGLFGGGPSYPAATADPSARSPALLRWPVRRTALAIALAPRGSVLPLSRPALLIGSKRTPSSMKTHRGVG